MSKKSDTDKNFEDKLAVILVKFMKEQEAIQRDDHPFNRAIKRFGASQRAAMIAAGIIKDENELDTSETHGCQDNGLSEDDPPPILTNNSEIS